MLHMPTPMLMGSPAPTGPTYAEWVAYETARTTERTWSQLLNTVGPIGGFGAYRVTCAAPAGTMGGSPWGDSTFYGGAFINSNISRMVQHCFPSQAVFDAQVVAGRVVTFSSPENSRLFTFNGLNRNGYASFSADGQELNVIYIDDFRYFDEVVGPVKINPRLMTGPTPYELV